MSKLQGVITALVTPFKNGAVDYDSFRRLLKDQIRQGVHGFVVNGTTAESPTLTFDEVKKLYETTRAESSLPVIVGTGSNSTAATAEFTKKVCEWKPDGVLVVVPYYNKPPQRGLQKHFEEVAKNSNVPVILYNVPGRTITSLEPATVGSLCKTANIAGIKDATGDMNVLAATQKEVAQASGGKSFAYLSGDDGTCVDFASKGGHGVISVSSHVIGGEMAKSISQAKAGDKAAAKDYAEKYADLMKWLYCEANPIPVKMALKMMGVIDSGEMRLPLMALDEKFHKDLQACLKSLRKI